MAVAHSAGPVASRNRMLWSKGLRDLVFLSPIFSIENCFFLMSSWHTCQGGERRQQWTSSCCPCTTLPTAQTWPIVPLIRWICFTFLADQFPPASSADCTCPWDYFSETMGNVLILDKSSFTEIYVKCETISAPLRVSKNHFSLPKVKCYA